MVMEVLLMLVWPGMNCSQSSSEEIQNLCHKSTRNLDKNSSHVTLNPSSQCQMLFQNTCRHCSLRS